MDANETEDHELVEVRVDDLRTVLDGLNLWCADPATEAALRRLLVAIGQGVEG